MALFHLNPDKETVARLRRELAESGGYCPCRAEHSPENKCICQEFREQLKDPEFHGFCLCKLYYKK